MKARDDWDLGNLQVKGVKLMFLEDKRHASLKHGSSVSRRIGSQASNTSPWPMGFYTFYFGLMVYNKVGPKFQTRLPHFSYSFFFFFVTGCSGQLTRIPINSEILKLTAKQISSDPKVEMSAVREIRIYDLLRISHLVIFLCPLNQTDWIPYSSLFLI